MHELLDGQVEVHWQHPRHELEKPVLLVWPNPLRDEWAAEVVADGLAAVVCHMQLYEVEDFDPEEDDETERVQKYARPVFHDDPIPGYVAEALLAYDGEYGPIDEVVNPYDDFDEFEADTPERAEKRLEEYRPRELQGGRD